MIRLYISKKQEIKQDILEQFSSDRKRKLLSLKQQADMERSYTGNLLLWIAFQENRKKQTAFQTVSYKEGGKPYLKEYPDFCFSIAHSGNYVICAVAEQEIGVDIQKEASVKEGFAERFLTVKEAGMLAGAEEPEKTERFFRIWTAKEAYLKYKGTGLRQAPESFEVSLEKREIQDGINSAFFMEHCLQKEDGTYYINVCTKEKDGVLDIISVE